MRKFVELSGSLVLSTGKQVRVRVELDCPALTRPEEREVEQARIVLHDLTPIRVPESRRSRGSRCG